MTNTNEFNSFEQMPIVTSGEPTDQLEPEEDEIDDNNSEETDDADFDETPIADDDDDLDDDEVKRLFPGEDDYTNDDDSEEEPYEGIRHGDQEDEGLVDDNMSTMPVIPSPS